MINFGLNTCWRLIPTTKGLVNTTEAANTQPLPLFLHIHDPYNLSLMDNSWVIYGHSC